MLKRTCNDRHLQAGCGGSPIVLSHSTAGCPAQPARLHLLASLWVLTVALVSLVIHAVWAMQDLLHGATGGLTYSPLNVLMRHQCWVFPACARFVCRHVAGYASVRPTQWPL